LGNAWCDVAEAQHIKQWRRGRDQGEGRLRCLIGPAGSDGAVKVIRETKDEGRGRTATHTDDGDQLAV
jgi:hypothetical protein